VSNLAGTNWQKWKKFTGVPHVSFPHKRRITSHHIPPCQETTMKLHQQSGVSGTRYNSPQSKMGGREGKQQIFENHKMSSHEEITACFLMCQSSLKATKELCMPR